MMIIIPFLMLIAPGLIALRMLWGDKSISRSDYKLIICDYIIYSFLIVILTYAVMFLSYPERGVSFSTRLISFDSIIFHASFVVKYSFVALASALILPIIVPKLVKVYKPHIQGKSFEVAKSSNTPDDDGKD